MDGLMKISVLMLSLSYPSVTIRITDVHTPGVIKNGTRINGVNNIIDCEYQFDERDVETFELKWYFRHDPTPIYTWVPPNRPQVASRFRKHISNGYLSNSGELTKHSALYLRKLTTELSGRYSCKVSSVHEEDFKSKDFIIYAEPKEVRLNVEWSDQSTVNVHCSVKHVYPEPVIKLFLAALEPKTTRINVGNGASRNIAWSNMAYNVSRGKSVRFNTSQIHANKKSRAIFNPVVIKVDENRFLVPELKLQNNSDQIMKKESGTKFSVHSKNSQTSTSKSKHIRGPMTLFDTGSVISSINSTRHHSRYFIDRVVDEIPIRYNFPSKRRKAKMMTMIYLCDSLNTTNRDPLKMSAKSKLKEYVQNIKQLGAKIECEVTIPGVEHYKILKEKFIPEYQEPNISNSGRGILTIDIKNIQLICLIRKTQPLIPLMLLHLIQRLNICS